MSAYELLGVPRNATEAEIRIAFKDKAMVNHPDRGGDPEAWADLQKAYDVLADPKRRAQYDASKLPWLTVLIDEVCHRHSKRRPYVLPAL